MIHFLSHSPPQKHKKCDLQERLWSVNPDGIFASVYPRAIADGGEFVTLVSAFTCMVSTIVPNSLFDRADMKDSLAFVQLRLDFLNGKVGFACTRGLCKSASNKVSVTVNDSIFVHGCVHIQTVWNIVDNDVFLKTIGFNCEGLYYGGPLEKF